MYQMYNIRIRIIQVQTTCGSMLINLFTVSAKVFLIPFVYSKVIQKGDISIAQLLTLEFKVFLAKNFFKGKWSLLRVISASYK